MPRSILQPMVREDEGMGDEEFISPILAPMF